MLRQATLCTFLGLSGVALGRSVAFGVVCTMPIYVGLGPAETKQSRLAIADIQHKTLNTHHTPVPGQCSASLTHRHSAHTGGAQWATSS